MAWLYDRDIWSYVLRVQGNANMKEDTKDTIKMDENIYLKKKKQMKYNTFKISQISCWMRVCDHAAKWKSESTN